MSALLLATIVVAPPLISLNRLHGRIAESISQAIGRPVRMSSITMRLLPRPGFQISDFVVDEDPAFGAEPVLRSSQVLASVRILPLWRGRIEIARISFDEPSINLVRNRDGRWNFDSLLSQAAQLPKAPTAERHPGGLTRFPYIDAGNARINFKSGVEKLPFSFLDADLAVWLANPGEWRIEFAAQPARTDLDLDLGNTGIVRLTGSLRHAQSLDRMPMQLHAEWSNAPIVQLSRIFLGADSDWRGQLDTTADISGTADQADLKLNASGLGIHRAEFEPRQPLNLNVACQARFARRDRLVDRLTCLVPTGDGHLLLTGSLHAMPAKIDPALSLEINHLPVSAALDGLRLFRAGFAPTVDATGTIDGNFSYTGTEGPASQVDGQATVNRLTLAAPAFEKPLALPPLRFSMSSSASERPLLNKARRGSKAHSPPSISASFSQPALVLEPFTFPVPATSSPQPGALPASPVASPAASMMTASGLFDPDSFSLHLQGEAQPGAIGALGKNLGLLHNHSLDFGGQGLAAIDLTLRGPWVVPMSASDQATPPASVDGSVRLRNAQFSAPFLAQPVRIASAQATFNGNQVQWVVPSLVYGPVHADGSLSYPVFCLSSAGCVPAFTLHLASLDAATAQTALLGAGRHGAILQELLDRIRSLNQSGASWPALSGTVQIGDLTIQNLELRDVAAETTVEGRIIQLNTASARTLDGQLRLTGAMEVAGRTPRYELHVQLDHASATAAAALFSENWGPGTISLQTHLKFAGFEQRELLASASGTFHSEWTNGGLPFPPAVAHPTDAPATATPLRRPLSHFDRWTAEGTVDRRALRLESTTVSAGNNSANLTGSITFDRELDLASPGKPGVSRITGTLQHPDTTEAPSQR